MYAPASLAVTPRVGTEDETDPRNDEDDYDDEPTDLCCLGGCVAGLISAFLFVLVLPAGILMTVYGSNNEDTEVLLVGVLLVALALVSLPILVIIIINRRRLRKLRKRRISSIPNTPVPEVFKY